MATDVIFPGFIEQKKEQVNIGGTIVTSLVFVTVLGWIEFLLYDFRHPLNEQDLVSEQDGITEYATITGNKNRSKRKDYFLFAVMITIITIIAIILLRKFPISVNI